MEERDQIEILNEGFFVGDYFVEPDAQRIRIRDRDVRIEPKVMDVLIRLAQQPGKTVTQEEFMAEVWSEAVVTVDALLRCISELRKLFGDDPQDPRYIETIRKRGYRLIAPVTFRGAESPGDDPPADQAPGVQPQEPTGQPERPFVEQRAQKKKLWMGIAATLTVLLVITVVLWRAYVPDTPDPLRSVPLTSLLGVETDPNLSPDGSRVAFVWDKGDGGNFDIFVKQIGVETPVRLTSSPSDDRSPTWSPDGQSIAYVRTGPSDGGLYVVPALGGSPRRVANVGEMAVNAVAWSPDGETLAFAAATGLHGPFGIWLLSLETSEMRRLTQPPADYRGDVELAYSPDGRFIAFVRSLVERVDDIYLVGTSGAEVKRLTFDHAEITGLDWSTDSRSIVYSSDREGAPALWRISVSGRTPRWIPTATRGSGVHQPSISRTGESLAFVQRVQEINIWSHALPRNDDPLGSEDAGDQPEEARPIITSTQWDSNPSVSPDGAHVTFASNRSGNYEIWMSDADGANPVQLTRLGGPFASTPRWSPDGSRIAFAGRGEGNVDIYLLEVTGGRIRRLTSANANDQAPRWSRDGEWIYFGSNRTGTWQVWKIPVSGGNPEQVTRQGGYAATEAPDGNHVYFVKREEPGIWHLDTVSGAETQLIDALQPFDWGNWAVTEDAIYFVHRDHTGARIARYALDAGTVDDVLALDALPRHSALALFPDGRRILVSRTDRVEGDIYLVKDFR